MNKSQAKKKILIKLEERGSEFAPAQSGRFMSILLHRLGLASSSSGNIKTVVTEALEALEDEQKIKLNRVGKQIVGMSMIVTEHVDLTESEGNPVPSGTVPDQRTPDESETAMPEVPAAASTEEVQTIGKPGDPATLSACLAALRDMANPDGVSEPGTSMREVLMLIGLTESQAIAALSHLRSMSLYTSKRVGYGLSVYEVALQPAVITAEMVQNHRSSQKLAKAKTENSVTADDQNPLQKLAAIIVDLETQVADLTSKVVSANARLDTAANQRRGDLDKIKRRDAKLEAAIAEIDRLQTELSIAQNQQLVIPESVAKVLDRHS